ARASCGDPAPTGSGGGVGAIGSGGGTGAKGSGSGVGAIGSAGGSGGTGSCIFFVIICETICKSRFSFFSLLISKFLSKKNTTQCKNNEEIIEILNKLMNLL
ncbi:MAG: hypothetical protein VW646_04170, partial [Hydrogenophilales bacterium]